MVGIEIKKVFSDLLGGSETGAIGMAAQESEFAILTTPGQRNEGPEFNVMNACLINTFRKANRPEALAADKAYSSKAIRDYIAKREIEDVIPTRSNEIRDSNFDKVKYKKRNVVERAIGWIKEYRRIATRYEKNVENYLAMIHIAIIRIIINWN